MYKVLVFAGTTEGYEICRFLADHKIETKGFVATEYGSKSLTENEFLTVQTGRLDVAAMEETFLQEKPEIVLDATHPYAAEVTVNIRTACEKTQTAYYRVLREAGEHEDRAVYVDSVQAATDYLDQTQGNVLLTTGSKELAGFTGMKDYQNRLYARVLSLPNVMKACAELGFEGKHLIGMQGPFSRELNAAMLRQYDCRYLVTKDTGKAGGFQDKIDAALECDAVPVIIGRPLKEEGMSVRECKRFLTEHFSLAHRPHITLLGIGMGSQKLLTVQGKNSLDQADQILEMVIRGKMVFVTKQVVGHAVVARIDKNVDIIATSGSLDKALSITGLETRAVRRNDESVHIHSHFTRPAYQMAVYQVAKLLCTRASQQCQISDRGFFAEKVAGAHRLFCHNISSFIDFHCAFVCAYCGGFCRTSKHILTHTHRKNSPYFLFLLCFRHFPRFAHSSTFFYQKILYDFTIS